MKDTRPRNYTVANENRVRSASVKVILSTAMQHGERSTDSDIFLQEKRQVSDETG